MRGEKNQAVDEILYPLIVWGFVFSIHIVKKVDKLCVDRANIIISSSPVRHKRNIYLIRSYPLFIFVHHKKRSQLRCTTTRTHVLQAILSVIQEIENLSSTRMVNPHKITQVPVHDSKDDSVLNLSHIFLSRDVRLPVKTSNDPAERKYNAAVSVESAA